MNTKVKLLQPLLDMKLSQNVTSFTSISIPARMDIYEFHLDKNADHTISFIPSPYCEWIIGYDKNPESSIFCCVGATSSLKSIVLPHYDYYIGIRFDDNVCYISKNASNSTTSAGMRNQYFEYHPSADSYEYHLIDRLASSLNVSDKVAHITQFLEASKRLCPIPDNTNQLFTSLKKSNGALSVSELSKKSGYSQRHISRIISSQFGYGPKEYCKYIRIQRALAEILRKPDRSNSEFIQNIGYSDQAHFQREFKLFLGMTPKQFIHEL